MSGTPELAARDAAPSDVVCQVCGEPLGARPQRRCPHCETPHHDECWRYMGGCSTYGCEGRPLAQPLPVLGRSAEVAPVGGGLRRLDLTTPLEATLDAVALLGLLGAFLAPFVVGDQRYVGVAFSVSAAVGLVAAALRHSTDCTYLLDEKARSLRYSRTFLGRTSEWPVCSLDAVAAVAVIGRRASTRQRTYWEYGVALVTGRGDVITVSDLAQGVNRANAAAQDLGRELGVRRRGLSPGECELVVHVDRTGEVQVVHRPWAPTNGRGRATLWAAVVASALAPLAWLPTRYLLVGLPSAALQVFVLHALLVHAPRGAVPGYVPFLLFSLALFGQVVPPAAAAFAAVGLLATMLLAFW